MWRQIMTVAAVLTLCAPSVGAAQSQADANTFMFPAEFVSADPTANTVTLKARLAYDEATNAVKQLEAGQEVQIVWSGFQTFADAIRTIRPASGSITENMVTPGVLVSPELDRQYVTLRVQAPAADVAEINALEPGDWVTVTARHQPSDAANAIVSVEAYTATDDAD